MAAKKSTASLAKIGERLLDAYADPDRDEAKQKAKKAIEQAGKRTKHRVSGADVAAVEERLHDAGLAMLAIRELVIDGEDRPDATWLYGVAIRELARSTAMGIDACVKRLTGSNTIEVSEFD